MSYTSVGILTPISTSNQAVTFDASVATTAAFTRGCVFEVTPTQPCHMRIGTAPVALATDLYLAAGVPRQFPCVIGSKVAFIKATGGTAGVAHVSELQ